MNNTQTTQVLDHLKQECYRLSAIIKRLRNQGYEVVTYNERNNSGTGTHAPYELKGV